MADGTRQQEKTPWRKPCTFAWNTHTATDFASFFMLPMPAPSSGTIIIAPRGLCPKRLERERVVVVCVKEVNGSTGGAGERASVSYTEPLPVAELANATAKLEGLYAKLGVQLVFGWPAEGADAM